MINFMTVQKAERNNGVTIYNVDGYTTRRTYTGAAHEVGRAIASLSKTEADLFLSAKTEAEVKGLLCPFRAGEDNYIFELEEVSQAARYDEETDTMDFADGSFYFHVRFFVWDEVKAKAWEEQEQARKKEEQEQKEQIICTIKGRLQWLFELYFIRDYKRLLDESYGFCMGYRTVAAVAYGSAFDDEVAAIYDCFTDNVRALHWGRPDMVKQIDGLQMDVNKCEK